MMHKKVRALLFPRTPEEWERAINTPNTPANFLLITILAEVAFTAFAIKTFFEQMLQLFQLTELQKEAMVQEYIKEQKAKEEAQVGQREMDLRLIAIQTELATGKVSGDDLFKMQAEVEKTLGQLTTQKKEIQSKIRITEDKIDAIGEKMEERRVQKADELKKKILTEKKFKTLYDANNQATTLKGKQHEKMVEMVVDIASRTHSPELIKSNPEMVKQHEQFVKEDLLREGERQKQIAEGEDVGPSKVKPIVETQIDKLNVWNELDIIFLLSSFYRYNSQDENLRPSQLSALAKNNGIHEILSEVRKNYTAADKEQIKELFLQGAQLAHQNDDLKLTTETANALEGVKNVIAQKISSRPQLN